MNFWYNNKIIDIFIISILLSSAAIGAAQQKKLWTGNIYFENDLFTETDQNYTNGIKFSLVSPNLQSFEEDDQLPDWFTHINQQLTFFHPKIKVNHNIVISFAQVMYTPEDIDSKTLIEDQRPYAGWLYFGTAYHARSEHQLDTIELNLGVVGPLALAHETQDFIHDLRGLEKSNGWDNQLKNEPGLIALYEHKHKFISQTANYGIGYDVILHAGGAVGNVATYLNTGFSVRGGWKIPDDFGTSSVRPGGDNSAPGKGWVLNNGFGIHMFASVDSRFVIRDIFLDGNTFRDSHSVDKELWVADASVGLSVTVENVKISFARVFRTREFKKQPHSHSYGSLSISFWQFF
ncbi:lipid A deacylase LpxR family protein [Endozoicomonas sp. SM1973]|uniref:Lipid A deacylase LpxR family protein n=1 Tax=Spartinivicinus marinus TaxID=2994442 RepID=A0A853HWR9_9GAMM|nr:lipid A deacylase LpxR family protein [Spartinivicinus marinus]MCX4028135.1 lipid A deacylase LpxR family protein [Spartinivicinus marinus]NYZ66190.1 lipid A deacylase LpxR family protein [Spartinivicinus marinus]